MSIIELAKLVKSVVTQEFKKQDQIKIITTPSNDNRSYHINSDKIFKTLGFKAGRSLEEAVGELCFFFKKGMIKRSFEDDMYYNVRRLKSIQAK